MILLAAFAAALVFLLPSSSRAANPQLCAQVGQGDAFTISLKGADCTGADLTQIDAGTSSTRRPRLLAVPQLRPDGARRAWPWQRASRESRTRRLRE